METSPGDSGTSTPTLVAVGGSAGGVEALRSLVRKLPGDLPAAALVLVHIPTAAPPDWRSSPGPVAAVERGSPRLAGSSEKSAREAERSAELIEAQLAGGSAGPGSP